MTNHGVLQDEWRVVFAGLPDVLVSYVTHISGTATCPRLRLQQEERMVWQSSESYDQRKEKES